MSDGSQSLHGGNSIFKALENNYNLGFQADRTNPARISKPESADHVLEATKG